MSQVITAIFEDGILKPEMQLAFPPKTRVRLTIERLDEAHARAQQAWEELEQLCAESPIDAGGVRLTRDQLHERR